MICPLLTIAARPPSGAMLTPRDCLRQKCAWWNEDKERCAVTQAAYELWHIRTALLVQSGHQQMPDDW